MNVLKKILLSISHFLLAVVRVLRRTICCKRKKDADYILPLTINQVNDSSTHQSPGLYEYHSQWGAWPETTNSAPATANNINSEKKAETQNFQQEESFDDLFKDMVPQIRKPKKVFIRKEVEEREECFTSNRLAMDPKAILSDPDLGIIEDNPSNWEDVENSEEGWDPDQLIRETKRAEREKRLAEHQRRKQERENRRASKQDSSSSIAILNLSDSKDKAKSS